MIRVDTDGVMQYKLVEDAQVTRTETRTIAARLSREDADQIAGLLNQAEVNKKLDAVALKPGRVELFPYADVFRAANFAADGWIPSTRYPGTFENQAGMPCPCFHCKTGRKVADAVPQYSIRPMTGSNVLWQLLREDLIIAGDMTRQNAEFILSKVRGEQQ